jgi:hypothetical protein
MLALLVCHRHAHPQRELDQYALTTNAVCYVPPWPCAAVIHKLHHALEVTLLSMACACPPCLSHRPDHAAGDPL